LVESAVEPTRSVNIISQLATLGIVSPSWRGRRGHRGCRCGKLPDSSKHCPPMSEQHTDVFEVLIGQSAKLMPFSAKRSVYSDAARILCCSLQHPETCLGSQV
jgi:hypothetical protein